MDGQSYYSQQSKGRGIFKSSDVQAIADFEKNVFDYLILPYLPSRSNIKIYEAAVGPGILQKWLQACGYKDIEGSDFSCAEVAIANEFNPRLIVADSTSDLTTRFTEKNFDAVLALDFYEHLPREEFRRFLEAVLSRLKPGGILILRGPNGDSPFVGCNLYNDITHVWAYTTICLSALLRIAGFSKVSFSDDTRGAIHSGRWWKLPLMVISQKMLSFVCWAATRVKVKFWGSSIYVYAWR
jgi:2-polyprenyl-3-methyl-5-hydroxy-6-metoxy-1,4-benzoquinol methylase